MTSFLQKIWSFLHLVNGHWKAKTQPIRGKTDSDLLKSLRAYFDLSNNERKKLSTLKKKKKGSNFITQKVDEVNRYASHRTAFLANALVQLLLVNLASISLLGFIPNIYSKLLLVSANLLIALLAWRRVRACKQTLLQGPATKPKWSIWGAFRGNRRKHNKHIKAQAKPYKTHMSDERLFRMIYLINAITIFFASQLLWSDHLPALLRGLINFPLFIITLPLAIANAYWAFGANSQVVKAATQRGNELDKLKL